MPLTKIKSLGITDGTIAIADLSATGTPSSATFLRGDNTWGSAGATAGQVIQVVSTSLTTAFTSTSTSFVDVTGLSASITPASTSNKILILLNFNMHMDNNCEQFINILRNSTGLGNATYGFGEQRFNDDSSNSKAAQYSVNYLDSPSLTSSITYKVQFKGGNANISRISRNSVPSTITLLEIKG